MRRTLASPNLATSSNSPPAICGEVLSASINTAKRGSRCCSAFAEHPRLWRRPLRYWRDSTRSGKTQENEPVGAPRPSFVGDFDVSLGPHRFDEVPNVMTIRLHRGDLPDLSRYTTSVAIDTETMGLNPHR